MSYSIPQETIENIRSQADIVQVISEYLTLKKAGSNYKACCPFHKEKTPSFIVSPTKQLYHCFGCGAGGNVFGFLMRQEGFTFTEAARHLAERAGIQIKERKYAPGEEDIREQLFEVYEFATGFFHRCLMKSPQSDHARNYLKNRQLSQETVKQFSIGHAPTGWDSLLSAASKKGFSKELLLRGGLAKKSAEGRVYDAFRNRIMFPIWGLNGKVIAFGGRALEDNQPKYINSPETPIYQKGQTLYNLYHAKSSISSNNTVVIVEGYTDLIRLAFNGFENVVASSGTAFTRAQARVLKRYANDVILVFDADSAGIAAAGRGIEVLLSEDLNVKVAAVPSGTDPDEFVLKQGARAFQDTLDGARSFVEFHVQNALASPDGSELENKIKTANILAGLIGKVPDPIRREEYLRLVASRLDLNPDTLLKASQKYASGDTIEEEVRHFEKRLRHDERECMWLIRLLMQRPDYIEEVRTHLEIASIENGALRRLMESIFEHEGDALNESMLLDRAQDEETQQILSRLMLEEGSPELMYPIEWWIGFIKSRQKERMLGGLSREIADAERGGNHALLVELLQRKTEVNRDLAETRDQMMKISVDMPAGGVVGR